MAKEPLHLNTFFIDLKSETQPQLQKLISQIFEGGNVLGVREMTEGMTNKLFRIETNVEGKRYILVRINGNNTEKIIDRDVEEESIVQLSKLKLGPELYCRFGNGTVYQYFNGAPLSPPELPKRKAHIGKKLAKFHGANVDFDKTPAFDRLFKAWMQETKQITFAEPEKQKTFESFNLAQIDEEVAYMLNKWVKNCDIGFCHNDLLAYNIIYDESADVYHFIDFEYCGYNYRAFDIGNHFCEYVGFEVIVEAFPTKEEQTPFLTAYLEVSLGRTPTQQDIDKLYKEVTVCSLLAIIFWAMWAVIQAKYSDIKFDYLDYAAKRFAWYRQVKDKALKELDQ